jgi:hypothetical protein
MVGRQRRLWKLFFTFVLVFDFARSVFFFGLVYFLRLYFSRMYRTSQHAVRGYDTDPDMYPVETKIVTKKYVVSPKASHDRFLKTQHDLVSQEIVEHSPHETYFPLIPAEIRGVVVRSEPVPRWPPHRL